MRCELLDSPALRARPGPLDRAEPCTRSEAHAAPRRRQIFDRPYNACLVMFGHDRRLLPLTLENLRHPSSRAVPSCSSVDAARSTATRAEAGIDRELAHPGETAEAAQRCAARVPACLSAPGRDAIAEGVSDASCDEGKLGE